MKAGKFYSLLPPHWEKRRSNDLKFVFKVFRAGSVFFRNRNKEKDGGLQVAVQGLRSDCGQVDHYSGHYLRIGYAGL
jgi:hypothetical protein